MTSVMTMKRKLEELEIDGSEVNYTRQRQSILDISMCKLKQPLAKRVEPSLRRSVLIFNTLKHIEKELRVEGVGVAAPSKLLPSIEDNSDITLDQPPSVDMLPPPMEIDSNGAPLSLAFPNPRVALHQSSSVPVSKSNSNAVPMETAPSAIREPVYRETTTSNGTSLLDISCSVTSSVPYSISHLQQTNSVPVSSYSTPDALSDIDSSLLDFEFIRSWTPSTKLSPLSSDDLTHAFPSNMSSVPFTEPYNVPCFKNDLLSEDLDNIMQILVGM